MLALGVATTLWVHHRRSPILAGVAVALLVQAALRLPRTLPARLPTVEAVIILSGVVASGQELGLLREALGLDPWIVVPGVRAPGEDAGDQVRTIEAGEAVRRGATHLVIGRPITAARDPVAAYRRLVEALD